MNDLQKQILGFAIAQSKVDSTPALALCCPEHKHGSWYGIQFVTTDIKDNLELGKALAKEQCLN